VTKALAIDPVLQELIVFFLEDVAEHFADTDAPLGTRAASLLEQVRWEVR
jgi:hypothetical protein